MYDALLVVTAVCSGLVVTALCSGLAGGVFFAFSAFVMTGLGRMRPTDGARAMQSIRRSPARCWR
jgi:uncharacterized membrane protein